MWACSFRPTSIHPAHPTSTHSSDPALRLVGYPEPGAPAGAENSGLGACGPSSSPEEVWTHPSVRLAPCQGLKAPQPGILSPGHPSTRPASALLLSGHPEPSGHPSARPAGTTSSRAPPRPRQAGRPRAGTLRPSSARHWPRPPTPRAGARCARSVAAGVLRLGGEGRGGAGGGRVRAGWAGGGPAWLRAGGRGGQAGRPRAGTLRPSSEMRWPRPPTPRAGARCARGVAAGVLRWGGEGRGGAGGGRVRAGWAGGGAAWLRAGGRGGQAGGVGGGYSEAEL
jgi:DNA polymerase-3 subunit gamma/tau